MLRGWHLDSGINMVWNKRSEQSRDDVVGACGNRETKDNTGVWASQANPEDEDVVLSVLETELNSKGQIFQLSQS